MEMMKNAISWFEIPVSDFNRAKKFYSTIYDFDMPEMVITGNQMGILLHDMNGGGIGGAIVKGSGYTPCQEGTKVYLGAGHDLSVVLNRVTGAGGKVITGKTEVAPGMGHMAAFEDTEGNLIFLHSSN